MANNLKKFNTESEYNQATLSYPAVSWVVSGDIVHFDKETPTPSFSGLTVYYNITDISQPTELFKGAGGSGAGSGAGGTLPSAMIVDGTAVEVTATYQFSTTGEHIINYSFADNQIPQEFLYVINYVTKAIIGDSVTSIGDKAFNSCSSLTSITIPNSVTTIGDSAFSGCNSLTSIDIPDSVTSIYNFAFYGCGLTSIDIPSGITSIGMSAFQYCSSLTSVTVNAVTPPTLGTNVFNGVSTNGVLTVPSGSQGYCNWIGGPLPSYWTIEGVTCGSGSGSGS